MYALMEDTGINFFLAVVVSACNFFFGLLSFKLTFTLSLVRLPCRCSLL